MLGWEVVEGQQSVPVLDQAFCCPRILRLEGLQEQIERGMSVFAGLGLPDVMQHFLGLGLDPFGKGVEHVAGLVHPASLLACLRENLLKRPLRGGMVFAEVPIWASRA